MFAMVVKAPDDELRLMLPDSLPVRVGPFPLPTVPMMEPVMVGTQLKVTPNNRPGAPEKRLYDKVSVAAPPVMAVELKARLKLRVWLTKTTA